MTRLSSSQQINQNGINPNSNCHSSGNVTQITSKIILKKIEIIFKMIRNYFESINLNTMYIIITK